MVNILRKHNPAHPKLRPGQLTFKFTVDLVEDHVLWNDEYDSKEKITLSENRLPKTLKATSIEAEVPFNLEFDYFS